MQFQSKDIQKLVGIPKYRYDYLLLKTGIKPEIEEVEKTGHTHLYSFKNLLEFAIVNTVNNFGLGPKKIKQMIKFLSTDKYLFDPYKKQECFIYYFKLNGRYYFEWDQPKTFDCCLVVDLGILKRQILKGLK